MCPRNSILAKVRDECHVWRTPWRPQCLEGSGDGEPHGRDVRVWRIPQVVVNKPTLGGTTVGTLPAHPSGTNWLSKPTQQWGAQPLIVAEGQIPVIPEKEPPSHSTGCNSSGSPQRATSWQACNTLIWMRLRNHMHVLMAPDAPHDQSGLRPKEVVTALRTLHRA